MAVTIIAIIAVIAVVFFAVRYIVREKKKGNKCVGCAYGGECCKYSNIGDINCK